MSKKLTEAREYEANESKRISPKQRPVFHVTPYIGWLNDPNGFSYYKGQFHLFYQYHPYSIEWGPMHWGHVVSDDLLHWKYLPCAMTVDAEYDKNGVFSGSATELPDGRQLLMYTGVSEIQEPGSELKKNCQTQCLAIGDGLNYQKWKNNPVIDPSMMPEGTSKEDFRDPKIVPQEDGTYRCYVSTKASDGGGEILVYRSEDGFHWEYSNILTKNGNRVGKMWECPDFFTLDGKQVLFVSPMEIRMGQIENRIGYCSIAIVGTVNPETGKLDEEWMQPMDYGIDFYAHQTMTAPDGRQIMVAWMQNWETTSERGENFPWMGQMTVPRELWIEDGRIHQRPVRELDACRTNPVKLDKQIIGSEEIHFDGVEGRVLDLTLRIRPADEAGYHAFRLRFAEDESRKNYCEIKFRPDKCELSMNRLHSGSCRALVHKCTAPVRDQNGELTLRLILDRFSAEVFLNGGEQTMSMVYYTDIAATGIGARTEHGNVELSIEKYDIV